MNRKYDGFDILMQKNQSASSYYERLPDYVQDMIGQQRASVNSYENLVNYAENLLKGDI